MAKRDHDDRPFPIQGSGEDAPSNIPWWLARVAFEYYEERWPGQSLRELAARGGFGREELVAFIRRKDVRVR